MHTKTLYLNVIQFFKKKTNKKQQTVFGIYFKSQIEEKFALKKTRRLTVQRNPVRFQRVTSFLSSFFQIRRQLTRRDLSSVGVAIADFAKCCLAR
jgi:hypothetical protein